MTGALYSFDTQPHGTAATAGNTGAAVVTATGGSVTFDEGMSFSGATGLKYVSSTGSNTAYTRFLFPAATTSGRLSFGLTMPPEFPAANMTILSIASAADTQLMAIIITPTGELIWRKSSGSNAIQAILAAAGVLAVNQRVRVEITQFLLSASGGVTIKLYNDNSGTQIGATTVVSGVDLGTTATDRFNIGIAGASSGSKTVGIDNVQLNDAPGAEIGPYWPAGVTPAPVERLMVAGGFSVVGGATAATVMNDASDTTYLEAPGIGADETFEVRVAVPLSDKDLRIDARMALDTGTQNGRLQLVEISGRVAATKTESLTSAWKDVSLVLTSAENAAIVQRTGLRLRFVGNPS